VLLVGVKVVTMKFLNKLNKTEKALLFTAIVLLLIWIVYSLVIEPLYNSWTRLNKDVEIAKIELKKAVKILRQREDVACQYNKYLDRFTTKESDEEEMALILNEIETQARSASIRIINMKPRRVAKNEFYRTFCVDLDTESSMRNILKFIKGLKDSKFSLCVEQLTLNSRARDPSILNGSMAISRFGIIPE